MKHQRQINKIMSKLGKTPNDFYHGVQLGDLGTLIGNLQLKDNGKIAALDLTFRPKTAYAEAYVELPNLQTRTPGKYVQELKLVLDDKTGLNAKIRYFVISHNPEKKDIEIEHQMGNSNGKATLDTALEFLLNPSNELSQDYKIATLPESVFRRWTKK